MIVLLKVAPILNPQIKKKSQQVFDILASLSSAPTEDQKKALSLALEDCTELVLDPLDRWGTQAFFEALKTNTTLKHLSLASIKLFDSKAIQTFAEALMLNKTLIHLELSSDLSDQAVNTVKKAIDLTKEGPIRPLTLIQFKDTLGTQNNTLRRALLKQRNRIEARAYVTGAALAPHMSHDVANIVADYLSFKGEHFTAGIKNQLKPQPTILARAPLSNFVKLFVCSGIGIVTGLIGVSLVWSGLCFLFLGLLLEPWGLIGFAALAIGLVLLGLSVGLWWLRERTVKNIELHTEQQFKEIMETDNHSNVKPAPVALQTAVMPVSTVMMSTLRSEALEEPPVNDDVPSGSQRLSI